MTLVPPRQAIAVHGHRAAQKLFREALAAGRLHHAWLLCGPEGIGKATLAYVLARLLLKGEDPDSAVGRRISAGTHADLLEIARRTDEKKGRLRSEITVADIQPVQNFLHHTAVEGGWRVVILDGADFLNRFAANAVLKILEEPPPRTIFFLTASSPGAILPTLRSRCRILPLSPLSDAEMAGILPGIAPELLARAHGSPGRAIFLAQDKDGDIARFAGEILSGRSLDAEAMTVIGRVAREGEGFALLCDLLGEGLAGQARERALNGALAEAAALARKRQELDLLKRQTEIFSLEKAQALRQALELAART